ncbi:MAG: protoheme IX farnesyltransferase [Anaerolineaceae bacterium]|nr:MAG: protoheme IX farnesyltransferase [Anaerolineaceae bacterium]
MSLPDIIEQETNTLGASATKHEANRSAKGWRGILSMLVVLFKLRVVFLLVVAATGGAFLGAGDWPGLNLLLLTWVTGGMAAAGSSALNQYWERRSDASMGRTSQRPLVTGEISDPRWVPIVGLLLIFIPALAVISFNPALTFFLLLGAFIYVVIYTMWLKPRTLLNVVIGGLAGSAAVLCGSAAAGMWNAPGALLLAMILFFWSPFHFWSLAMIYRDEYTRADFPMLPAKTTPQKAAWWIFAHTLPTGITGLLLALLPFLGWAYFVPVLLATVDLFWRSLRLLRDPSRQNALGLFISSNIYLLVLLLAVCVGTVLPF